MIIGWLLDDYWMINGWLLDPNQHISIAPISRFRQGTTIQWEHKLPDVPCAVQAFYHEAPGASSDFGGPCSDRSGKKKVLDRSIYNAELLQKLT